MQEPLGDAAKYRATKRVMSPCTDNDTSASASLGNTRWPAIWPPVMVLTTCTTCRCARSLSASPAAYSRALSACSDPSVAHRMLLNVAHLLRRLLAVFTLLLIDRVADVRNPHDLSAHTTDRLRGAPVLPCRRGHNGGKPRMVGASDRGTLGA